MTALTQKERWEARRKELRGKNRAVLIALLVLAAIFYFIAMVRFGAQL
jgi:hypothetical protein